jgi:hypothetical protein
MGTNGLFFILAFFGWQNWQRFCPVRFSPEIVQTTPATQAILDDHASPHGRHGQ